MLQKEKMAEIRQLIDSVPLGSVFDYAQLCRLNALTGWGALAAMHLRNPSFPRDPRHVRVQLVQGGPFVARSWRKAVAPATDTTRLMGACRFAVSDQMHEWIANQPRACAECGSDRDPTVDHAGTPFSKIVADWAGDRDPASLLRHRTTAEANSGAGALLLPGPWKEWRRHHKTAASYQVLCRSCNARKGAKHG